MSISFRFKGNVVLSFLEKEMIIQLIKNWKQAEIVTHTFKNSVLNVAFQDSRGKSTFAKLARIGKINRYQIAWMWYTKKGEDIRHWKYVMFLEKKVFPSNFTIITITATNPHNQKSILEKIKSELYKKEV